MHKYVDGGASWTTHAWGLVYHGGSAYSDMTLLPNGSIGVAWERGKYQLISFAVLTPPWAAASASSLKSDDTQ